MLKATRCMLALVMQARKPEGIAYCYRQSTKLIIVYRKSHAAPYKPQTLLDTLLCFASSWQLVMWVKNMTCVLTSSA